jgi:hypothetical protein
MVTSNSSNLFSNNAGINTSNLSQEDINKIIQALGQIDNNNTLSDDNALQNAINQSLFGNGITEKEAAGILAELQINDAMAFYNAKADLAQLGIRNALNLSSKSQESATLVASFREKTMGMFVAITEQRTNTVWGRMKQLTQGFKF